MPAPRGVVGKASQGRFRREKHWRLAEVVLGELPYARIVQDLDDVEERRRRLDCPDRALFATPCPVADLVVLEAPVPPCVVGIGSAAGICVEGCEGRVDVTDESIDLVAIDQAANEQRSMGVYPTPHRLDGEISTSDLRNPFTRKEILDDLGPTPVACVTNPCP